LVQICVILEASGKPVALRYRMPRKRLERSDFLPYHITARANNRERFPGALGRTWKVLTDEAWCTSVLYGAEFQALVLMPNHLHAILTVPRDDLGKVMNCLISSVTRIVNTQTGRCGHVFGGPYHWSLIDGTRYFGHALKYVYRNPVKAGLCVRVEEWPYSTVSGLMGNGHLPIPIHFTRPGMELGLPLEPASLMLDWLNQPFPSKAERAIQKGLRRKRFERILDRRHRRPIPELEQLL
jgi:REP element-mobilizing transposase RayT